MPTASIELIEDHAALQPLCDPVADIYPRAYSLPPYFENEGDIRTFKQRWPILTRKTKFRLVTAREPSSGTLLGFAYGWKSCPGDALHGLLSENLSAEQSALWTADSFEIADFALPPEHHGAGIGKKLYSAFFSGVPNARAVLKTHASESVAVQMYKKLGWITLIDSVIWGPKNLPYTAMGLDLHKRSE